MGSFPEHLISFSSLGPGSLYPSLLGCWSLCISHSENQGGRHTSPGGTQCRRKETLPLRRNSSTCPAAGHLLHPSSPWDAALAWADPHLSMTLRILPPLRSPLSLLSHHPSVWFPSPLQVQGLQAPPSPVIHLLAEISARSARLLTAGGAGAVLSTLVF